MPERLKISQIEKRQPILNVDFYSPQINLLAFTPLLISSQRKNFGASHAQSHQQFSLTSFQQSNKTQPLFHLLRENAKIKSIFKKGE